MTTEERNAIYEMLEQLLRKVEDGKELENQNHLGDRLYGARIKRIGDEVEIIDAYIIDEDGTNEESLTLGEIQEWERRSSLLLYEGWYI